MIYRILTEDKGNQNVIANTILRRFEGFTIIKAIGYYKGLKEKTLLVEIDTLDDNNALGIIRIAEEIKKYNSQSSVLVQCIKNKEGWSKLI